MDQKYKNDDYPDKLVAFLDILGFKALALQDKTEALKSINFIDERINHILNIINKEHDKTFSTKLFSDCICLSCEYTIENLFYILYESAFIQLYLSCEGIFLQGGLSKGNHFENERMIFSPGLIKAYELEQSAIYPRIIIDPDLIAEMMEDNNFYYAIYAGFKKQDFLIESPDGHFAVDYLNSLYEDGIEQIDVLKDHKKAIMTKVKQNNENIKVLEKYNWLAKYHNHKFEEFFNPEEWGKRYATETIKETSIDLDAIFPKFKKVTS